MRWERRTRDIKVRHKWFAWHPVVVYEGPSGKRYAWLETVWRQFFPDPAASGAVDNSKWEYGYLTPKDRKR